MMYGCTVNLNGGSAYGNGACAAAGMTLDGKLAREIMPWRFILPVQAHAAG